MQSGAQETGASSDNVQDAARKVADLTDGVKGAVDQFLRDIKDENQSDHQDEVA